MHELSDHRSDHTKRTNDHYPVTYVLIRALTYMQDTICCWQYIVLRDQTYPTFATIYHAFLYLENNWSLITSSENLEIYLHTKW